ncbi:MAG: hypothetical protein AB7I50_17180 [Vicinamibacterales bacterium]
MAGTLDGDPRLGDHLKACAPCQARLTELDRILAQERRAAVAEADAAFGGARLERQRASILRRIGGSRAAARILPFPGAVPTAPRPRHFWKRSIAAAAVAGVILGAVAGRLLPSRSATTASVPATAERAAAPRLGPEVVRAASWSADEQFLQDFEAAIGERRVEPLIALDALTPDWPTDFAVR